MSSFTTNFLTLRIHSSIIEKVHNHVKTMENLIARIIALIISLIFMSGIAVIGFTSYQFFFYVEEAKILMNILHNQNINFGAVNAQTSHLYDYLAGYHFSDPSQIGFTKSFVYQYLINQSGYGADYFVYTPSSSLICMAFVYGSGTNNVFSYSSNIKPISANQCTSSTTLAFTL